VARGWESKSVEEQQAEMAERRKPTRRILSPDEQRRNRQRDSLELARKRVSAQLEAAQRAEHREMLLRSIAEIDKQLASFDEVTESDPT
jgi:hypothetical protein